MNWLLEKLALAPDLSRAIRSSVAFAAALLLCLWLKCPAAIPFASTAAQVMCNPQFRGAYAFRLVVLTAMVAVFAGSALLGGLAAPSTVAAVLAMGALALLSGVWRHLSADYGQPTTVDAALFFLIALDRAKSPSMALEIAGWVALGAAGGSLVQVALWFVRPQHSLRHAVAECWVAAADLFSAMQAAVEKPDPAAADRVTTKQRELRDILDRTTASLAAANSRRDASFIRHLEKAERAIAHFAMQVIAFRESLQGLAGRPEFARYAPAVAAALQALGNMARSASITLITHRAENLASTELRLARCRRLLAVVGEQLRALPEEDCAVAQARSLLEIFEAGLKEVGGALAETVDQSTNRAMFPFRLPELNARSMRTIAAGLNPAAALDPALVRYAIRMAVLTMAAVALYRSFHIPRGYWMPFAMVVVLQPDYGATRKRAAQRVAGTFGGAVLGSALLWAPLPSWLFASLAVAMVFAFGYYLKRQYGLAVFFITLMLVLVTESQAQVHLDFTIGRLVSNAAGAALAFLAALVFWPSWERARFRALMAAAIRANSRYLAAVARQLAAGEDFMGEAVQAKREAEREGSLAAASLQRMLSEPVREQEDAARAAALVASSQRVTNAVTVLAAQLGHGVKVGDEAVGEMVEMNCRRLDRMAAVVGGEGVEGGGGGERGGGGEGGGDDRMPSNVSTFALRRVGAEVLALGMLME